ncbi:hypothetical protein ACWD6R_05195 [Streptomyces sp. NPDC005151]
MTRQRQERSDVLTGAPPHGLANATDAKLDNAVLRDLQLDQVIGWPVTG